jgi:hypothetical protein
MKGAKRRPGAICSVIDPLSILARFPVDRPMSLLCQWVVAVCRNRMMVITGRSPSWLALLGW